MIEGKPVEVKGGKAAGDEYVALYIGKRATPSAIEAGLMALRLVAMPCGVVPSEVLMERLMSGSFPLVDVPCPCGDPRHWLIKMGDK